MSVKEVLAVAGPESNSPGHGEPQAGKHPAHDDDAPTPNRTSVYVTGNSVVVVTPDHTRIENTERGVTHYGDPLPDRTRQALEVVSFYG